MKVIGPILTLIAVYILFFLKDDALFMQLVDLVSAWFDEYLSP